MKYMINWNWMMECEEFEGSLDDAKKYADNGICYNQQDCTITSADGEHLSIRRWNGVKYDEESDYCDNPILFDDFGYYSDWVDMHKVLG